MWFIGVEVEQETSAPPLKKNPGSAPALLTFSNYLDKQKPNSSQYNSLGFKHMYPILIKGR